MTGTVLDFSIQTNTGLISGKDGKRYSFVGAEWEDSAHPTRGMVVDFQPKENLATAVYLISGSSGAPPIIPEVPPLVGKTGWHKSFQLTQSSNLPERRPPRGLAARIGILCLFGVTFVAIVATIASSTSPVAPAPESSATQTTAAPLSAAESMALRLGWLTGTADYQGGRSKACNEQLDGAARECLFSLPERPANGSQFIAAFKAGYGMGWDDQAKK